VNESRTRLNEVACPTCTRGADPNCEECCNIIETRCQQFGYQQDVSCECHDICVQDVKLICVKMRTLTIPIGGLDTAVGCRGGVTVTSLPALEGCRIFCAEESLETVGMDACAAVNNEVGVEVVLRISAIPQDIIVVHRVIDRFTCRFNDFFRFPSGMGFTNDAAGRAAFREIIKFIDGSCKTIIIEDCRILNTTCPRVVVDLKVIDKLWKHENLLVSAIQPYPTENITIKEEFNAQHRIGPCEDPCPGVGARV
jgi:hypothetical protein